MGKALHILLGNRLHPAFPEQAAQFPATQDTYRATTCSFDKPARQGEHGRDLDAAVAQSTAGPLGQPLRLAFGLLQRLARRPCRKLEHLPVEGHCRCGTATDIGALRVALRLHCKHALVGDDDVVDVEVFGGEVMKYNCALAHQLIQFLTDSQFGIKACAQPVKALASFQHPPNKTRDEAEYDDNVHGDEVSQMRKG